MTFVDAPDFPAGAALIPIPPVLLRLSEIFPFSAASILEDVGVRCKALIDLRVLVVGTFILFIVEVRRGLEWPLIKDNC